MMLSIMKKTTPTKNSQGTRPPISPARFPSLVDQGVWNEPDPPVPAPKEKKEKKPDSSDEMSTMRVDSDKLVACRVWICTQQRNGCKGRTQWGGWEQIADPPACPKCGERMRWHQWGARIKKEV